jgi:hypothetical protein
VRRQHIPAMHVAQICHVRTTRARQSDLCSYQQLTSFGRIVLQVVQEEGGKKEGERGSVEIREADWNIDMQN